MTEKRGPGRPRKPGGPDRTRSLRLGSIYDQAKARADRRGEKITHIIERALEDYMSITMIATVATAGTITDKHQISVDETRDGSVTATPFLAQIHADEINLGSERWVEILAEGGWQVVGHWEDHDGYWTTEVERVLDLADLTRFLGAPDHDQEVVYSWTGETDRSKRWTEVEAAELAEIWKADTERIAAETN